MIAFQDIREVADWRRELALNADGEVVSTESSLVNRDAIDLSPSASKAIKSALLKGGKLRVDIHDKRAALETLVKLLSGSGPDMPANNVTVNTFNIGSMNALDIAWRVQFLLAKAEAERDRAP